MTRTLVASGYGGKIYTLAFDPTASDRPLSVIATADGGKAPTWFSLSERHPILYTTDEFAEPDGEIRSFRYSAEGHLTPVNLGKVAEGPVHIALTRDGRRLFTANYTSGSLSELKLKEDGSIDESVPARTNKYKGTRPNKARQEAPHVHGW